MSWSKDGMGLAVLKGMNGTYARMHHPRRGQTVAIFARRKISWAMLVTALASLSIFMMACGESPQANNSVSMNGSDLMIASQSLNLAGDSFKGFWDLVARDGQEVSSIQSFEIAVGESGVLCSGAITLVPTNDHFEEATTRTRCIVDFTRESELERANFRNALQEKLSVSLLDGRLVLSNDNHIFVFEKSPSN